MGDRRGAVAVIGGTSLGILTHAVLAGLGLAAVVMASSQAFVRPIGALVMIGLGLQLLWQSPRAPSPVVDQAEAGPPAVRVWSTLAKAYGAKSST